MVFQNFNFSIMYLYKKLKKRVRPQCRQHIYIYIYLYVYEHICFFYLYKEIQICSRFAMLPSPGVKGIVLEKVATSISFIKNEPTIIPIQPKAKKRCRNASQPTKRVPKGSRNYKTNDNRNAM